MIRLGDMRTTIKHEEAALDIVKKGMFTEGKYVNMLEREMEAYLGVKHAILTSNGTVSLQLIAHYLQHKLKRKLKFCVPAMTFPATYNAFKLTGNDIILCDVGEDMQIDLNTLNKKQLKKIDVIVPVHLIGYPCNMDIVMEFAKKYNWIVLEDCAEAFGAEFNGRKVGTFGDFGSFSFYASHNIWAGELGMVTTNGDDKPMRAIKKHGRVEDPMKFNHPYVGSNYKTTEFSAAMCHVNLQDVEQILKKRWDNSMFYFNNIKNPNLTLFPVPKEFSPLGYPIQCKDAHYRDIIAQKMKDNGVEYREMFPCLSNLKGKFPIAEKLSKSMFYIPSHQELTKEDIQKITEVLSI